MGRHPKPFTEAVNGARSEIELVLEMSPSLRSEIGVAIETEHGCGARLSKPPANGRRNGLFA
jgi:hypothetical protein